MMSPGNGPARQPLKTLMEKHMKKTKWIALALVGGLALGASAMGCHHRHPGGKMAYYGDKIVKKMSKKLDLDEAQKAKLDAMKETMLQARKDFKEERGNQMEDFVAMLRSEDFNEKKANDWLDKKQAKMEETRRTG